MATRLAALFRTGQQQPDILYSPANQDSSQKLLLLSDHERLSHSQDPKQFGPQHLPKYDNLGHNKCKTLMVAHDLARPQSTRGIKGGSGAFQLPVKE